MTIQAPASVIVHPLVLLSVVDHYNRTAKNTKNRVVGVLLGQVLEGGVVNVANSFALPFEEDDKDPSVWFIDHNYYEAMYGMFRKVNGNGRLSCHTSSSYYFNHRSSVCTCTFCRITSSTTCFNPR